VDVVDANQPGLLLVSASSVVHAPNKIVHLVEKVIPVDVPDGVWVLKTDASNHMTGTRSALT